MSMRTIGFGFEEVMEGTLRREGETGDRPFRFVFDVQAPDVAGFLTTAVGVAAGRVDIDGLATNAPSTGTLELSPFRQRRIRYTFEFAGDDGAAYRFDGWKSIRWLHARSTWTTLPGTLYDGAGRPVAAALLRFSFRRHLRGLLASVRLTRHTRAPVGA